ncbi:MAG TPA: TIGR00266 family protein [Acidimicrobiales bacterium]|nr:TIGR00266 family protein [Acidimicrobiales bacterium]
MSIVGAVNVTLRHSPSFAVARVTLAANEELRAESGAMMATSPGVSLSSSTQGGVLKGLKRSVLGGESLFVTTYTAPAQGGWVDVAHHLSGDVLEATVAPDQPMSITKGSWLASASGVELDTKWGGFKNLFGGEGGFLVHASGEGTVLLACYGALDTIELAAGESVTIDTGHVVAFGPTVTSQIRKVAGTVVQTLKSGEGFVFDFTGPGWVMTQSRNPSALAAWIRQLMPGETGGAGGGVLGGILGGR